MIGGSHAKRLTRGLAGLRDAKLPTTRLAAVRLVRESAEGLEQAHVDAAREAGMTWADIGAVYGLTKQGAQQRFRKK